MQDELLPQDYIEEYVEVVDNRKRVYLMVAVLLFLLLLLAALVPFMYNALKPPGEPSREALGEGLTWIRSIYGWGETPDTMLQAPTDAAFGPDGTVWAISGHRVIAGFNDAGIATDIVVLPVGEGEGEILSLEGIDVDEDGNLWVTDYGNAKVIKLQRDGTVQFELYVSFPQVVSARDGLVAVAAVPGVAVFDGETGELLSQWGGRGQGLEEFDGAHGVELIDGVVHVSDGHNRRIKAYTVDGEQLWVYPEDAAAASANDPERERPFELPQGLTVDAAGRVVFVDAFAFEIVAVDSKDGTVLERWGEQGFADGRLGYPTGIAYDASRDYFVVADTDNNRLQIIRLAGSGGGVGAAIGRATSGPTWICAIPLGFLLLVIIVMLLRRRAVRGESGTA